MYCNYDDQFLKYENTSFANFREPDWSNAISRSSTITMYLFSNVHLQLNLLSNDASTAHLFMDKHTIHFLFEIPFSKLNVDHPVIHHYMALHIDDIEDSDVPYTQNRRVEYFHVHEHAEWRILKMRDFIIVESFLPDA